jgi:hypothetical protein
MDKIIVGGLSINIGRKSAWDAVRAKVIASGVMVVGWDDSGWFASLEN